MKNDEEPIHLAFETRRAGDYIDVRSRTGMTVFRFSESEIEALFKMIQSTTDWVPLP